MALAASRLCTEGIGAAAEGQGRRGIRRVRQQLDNTLEDLENAIAEVDARRNVAVSPETLRRWSVTLPIFNLRALEYKGSWLYSSPKAARLRRRGE